MLLVVIFPKSFYIWNSPLPFCIGPLSYWRMALFLILFQCDLVYTFFHPLPRDEKAMGTSSAPKSSGTVSSLRPSCQLLWTTPRVTVSAPTSSQFALLDLPPVPFLTLQGIQFPTQAGGSIAPYLGSPQGGYSVDCILRPIPTQLTLITFRLHLCRCLMSIRNLTWRGWGKGAQKENRNPCLASWPFLVSFVPTDGTWARPVGKVGGEVKLSISYKNNKLFIMVMHIRGLVSACTALIFFFFFFNLSWATFLSGQTFSAPCHTGNHHSLLSIHHGPITIASLWFDQAIYDTAFCSCGLWQVT